MSLTLNITAVISRVFKYQAAATGPIFDDSNSFVLQDSLEDGTGADQANVLYHAVHTLATGGSVLLDMYGTLKDAFGSTISMARIKLIIVKHTGTTGTVTVGGGSNGLTSMWGAAGDAVKVEGEGFTMLWAPDATGYTVTSGTAENLRVLHNSDTVDDITVEVLVVGSTA